MHFLVRREMRKKRMGCMIVYIARVRVVYTYATKDIRANVGKNIREGVRIIKCVCLGLKGKV